MSPICPEISVACGHGGIPTGHVFRVERKRGPVWYAKYRLPDGRQVQKKVGPAWTERGRSANGYFTKRLAEEWLRSTLDEARRGTLPGLVRTGATFADAAAEWLRYVEDDRGRKPSTVAGYRSIVRSELLPHFGEMALESVTPPVIEAWQGSMTQAASTRSRPSCLCTAFSSGRARCGRWRRTPLRTWKSLRSPGPATSRCSRPRRCGRWFARLAPSRMQRCSWRPRSPACGWGSCWRCAGVTWTSRALRYMCGRATTPAICRRQSPAGCARCHWRRT